MEKAQPNWRQRYFRGLSLAMNTAHHSMGAAAGFQVGFRMWRVRSRYLHVLRCVRLVQRQFRAFLGRQKALAIRVSQAKAAQLRFFYFWATAIQRHFRGFYSRKHVHDSRSRRKFLSTVASRGQRTVVALHNFEASEAEKREVLDQQSEISKLKTVSSGLHHLVSTKNIPGVYNPPFPLIAPTIPDQGRPTPVEAFIKAAVKDVLSLKPKFPLSTPVEITKTKIVAVDRKLLLSVTANIGRQRSPQGPFGPLGQVADKELLGNFASLQASVPYGRMAEAARLERLGERSQRVGVGAQTEFRLTKTHSRSFLGSVAANAIFQEHTTESLFRGDYAIISRLKTFKSALPRNRFLHE